MAMAVIIKIGVAKMRAKMAKILSSIDLMSKFIPSSGVSDRVIMGKPANSFTL